MTQVTNTPYEALEVGQTASFSKTVEERDIQLFAAMSGDHNPVHLDAEYAKATMFKERIAHGMFSGALQKLVGGYGPFFIIVVATMLIGLVIIYLIPLDPEFGKKKKA